MSDNMLDRNNNNSRLLNKNVRYEIDVEYAIQINRWLFKPLGVWPLSHQAGGVERNFARFLIVVCSFLLGFILVPGSLYTFVKEKNAGVRVKLVGALSFCVMAIVKYGSLICSRRDIGQCIEHLVDDWRRVGNSGDRDIMLAHALFGRYGSVICAVFMYGGGLFYAGIMPLLRGSVVVAELNMTIRPLAYPSYYVIFDPQMKPAYRIVLSTHWCCAFVMHSIATAGCSMAVVFVMHACGQLEILVSWLNSLVDGNEKQLESLDTRIACVIDHHVRVLRFVSCVENILRTICLVEMAGCTLNLCLLGHYFLLVRFLVIIKVQIQI
nr:olfactory receptor 81 [Gregopimpla kuwanae]